ncbi:MAG TPA: hypothetical protein VJ997_09905 [Longimicrobiales bacterium]|nr:hypothetical protein [Longimicrobiales bacterium]
MSPERATWRDVYPEDTATCVRCIQVKDLMELDRLLWCETCRHRARERAAWWGWLAGLIFAGFVAAYVFLVVRPSDLVMGGWIATLVAAVWIGGRIGREIAYGVMRFRNSKAVDARP